MNIRMFSQSFVARLIAWFFLFLAFFGFFSVIMPFGTAFGHWNFWHNFLHLAVSGLIFYLTKKEEEVSALRFLGIFFVAIAIYGFLVGRGNMFFLINISPFDSWLHLGAGILMVYFGFVIHSKGQEKEKIVKTV